MTSCSIRENVTQNEFDALIIYRFLNYIFGQEIVVLLHTGSRDERDWHYVIVGGTKGADSYGDGWREREKSVYELFINRKFSYQGVEINEE